jgi:SNF2 family DNA or RNA helicase
VEKKKSSPKDESDSDGDDEKIDYRIEHILGRKSMTAREWVPITDKMWTREITKGSVLQQPDEEYFDPSEIPVEKFLIKWAHASYLHVSWETEKDLIDLVGNGVKHSIKKYLQREAERRDLFEDLAQGEYFPSSYIQIERILDVDDRDVNTSTIKWESLSLPDTSYVFASTATDAETGENPENVEEVEEAGDNDDGSDSGAESDPFADSDGEEDKADEANEADLANKSLEPTEAGSEEVPTKEDDNASTGSGDAELDQESPKRKAEPAKRRQAKRSKSTRGAKKNQHLHGENCWVTVKWEGLSYSDVSFESLNDIIRAKIDYESPLRTFYKREQAPPKDHQFNGPRKLNLDHTIIGPAAPQPSFPGGELRDYQWEGVRWMLFNLMQGRNSILADEMGLGKVRIYLRWLS